MLKAIVVCVCLMGCAYNHYITSYDITNMCQTKKLIELEPRMEVRIDSSFNKEEISQIIISFKEWQKAINNAIVFNFKYEDLSKDEWSWDCDQKISVYDGRRGDWRSGPRSKTGTGGSTFTDMKDIFLFQDGRYFKRIILHEIGHILLGTYHSKHKEDIMFPIVTNNEKLSYRDVVWACQRTFATIYPHIPEKILSCGYLQLGD